MSVHTKTADFSVRASEDRQRETQGEGEDGEVDGWAKQTKEIRVTVSDDALPTVAFRAVSEYGGDKSNQKDTRAFSWGELTSLMDAVEYGAARSGHGREFLTDVFGAYGEPTRVTDRPEVDSDTVTTLGLRESTVEDGADRETYHHLYYDPEVNDENDADASSTAENGYVRLPRVRGSDGPPERIGQSDIGPYFWTVDPDELVYTLQEDPSFSNEPDGVTKNSDDGFSPALRRALFVTRDPAAVEQLV